MQQVVTPLETGVYEILCTHTQMRYIGSTKESFKGRWCDHRSVLRRGQRGGKGHSSPHLQHVWNKYGEGSFAFSVVERCSPESRIEREQFYIDLYFERGLLLNAARKAESGTGKYSVETRNKIAHAARNISAETRAKRVAAATGRRHSAETREAIAKIRTGTKASPEAVSKMRDSHRKRLSAPGYESPKLTEEHKQKLSVAALGRKATPKTILILKEAAARMSPEARARRSRKGTTSSPETKRKIA